MASAVVKPNKAVELRLAKNAELKAATSSLGKAFNSSLVMPKAALGVNAAAAEGLKPANQPVLLLKLAN